MEGPTPVSALIHAATMVTAGVYMIVRCNVLYDLAPHASDLVAVVGAVTLLMAATIALVQEDIKRVLAWSTVSQIGYMIMGAGLGAYDSAMFHLLEHAFFKALLFLGVGIAIHALAGRAEPRPHGRPAAVPAARERRRPGRAAWPSPASRPSRASSARTRSWRPSLDGGALGITLAIVGPGRRPGSRPSTCSASTSAPSGAPSPRAATTSRRRTPRGWAMSAPRDRAGRARHGRRPAPGAGRLAPAGRLAGAGRAGQRPRWSPR